MTRLVIIRHGPTAWNADKRLQGHSDIPLSPEGRAMVATWRLPEGLERLRWVSSPLQRALDTARMLGAPDDIVLDHRLREIGYGAWEGMTYAEVAADVGEDRLQAMQDAGLDYAAPGGESRRGFHDRLTGWLADVAVAGAPTLAFAHQGVIRALVALALDWDYVGEPPPDYAGLRIRAVAHEFTVAPGGAVGIVRLNLPLGAGARSD
ncbi:MAG: histidine phosphatase family protein [Alphaproteobacteria bacterium]